MDIHTQDGHIPLHMSTSFTHVNVNVNSIHIITHIYCVLVIQFYCREKCVGDMNLFALLTKDYSYHIVMNQRNHGNIYRPIYEHVCKKINLHICQMERYVE